MNMRKQISVSLLIMVATLLSTGVNAEDKARVESQQRIYGSELMTQQERIEHRNRLQAATTEKARQEIRNEHHQKMQVRAKEKGVKLPDMPPEQRGGINSETGKGMGRRDGMGARDGTGSGMGQGAGQGMGGGMNKGRR